MIFSLMGHSRHEHTYVTFSASKARREQFHASKRRLVELGEDFDAAAAYMEENADIVHAANSGGPEPGVAIGLEAGKPVIETCQSPSLPSGHLHGAHVVPVSHGILSYWPDDLKIERVIYSSSEPIKKLDKRKAKIRFGMSPDVLTIGRVGRLEGLKRPQDFVGAVADIVTRLNLKTQFLLVGDGNDGDGIRNAVGNLKEMTGWDIHMPGFLRGEEKEWAYNAIDIFLYPTSMEGFGIVFAEAMSLAIPIITYSDPVNVDVVGAGGVFVPDNAFVDVGGTYSSLARTAIDLLYNERERTRIGERGLQIYNKRYRPETMAAEYDDLYESILARQ